MTTISQASQMAQEEFLYRSYIQRKEALDKANEVRTYRAGLKEDLKMKEVDILDLLMNPPEILQTMKVFDLLLATPSRGRAKVNKLLSQCRISSSKTIGGLSPRQRTELVTALRW